MEIILYLLGKGLMPWPAKTTIVKGKFIDSIVVKKIIQIPVEIRLGSANDNMAKN